jgi:DNA-binding XRE family transcriptional regulator
MREVASFGAWLKRRRKALDLTQAALARLVGCAVVSIRKIEADEQRPSRQTAERLAQHLQIAPDEQALFKQLAVFRGGFTRPSARWCGWSINRWCAPSAMGATLCTSCCASSPRRSLTPTLEP